MTMIHDIWQIYLLMAIVFFSRVHATQQATFWSVGPSVRRSVCQKKTVFRGFPFLPIRPRQMLPCIRPRYGTFLSQWLNWKKKRSWFLTKPAWHGRNKIIPSNVIVKILTEFYISNRKTLSHRKWKWKCVGTENDKGIN